MSQASKIWEMYAAIDMTVTMFKHGPNLVIDDHRTPERGYLMMEDNPAVWINHCKSSPNCVPKCVKVNGRCHFLIMATTHIPERHFLIMANLIKVPETHLLFKL